jgi:hypothetical protein
MNQLNVPWDKIQEAVESGMSMPAVADLFGIKKDTIRARSLRQQWATPKRKSQVLKKKIQESEEQGNRDTGSQKQLAIANAIMEDQLLSARGGQISTATATPVDFDTATKDYRTKGVLKMAKLLDATVIAPPRTWKDYDIADKMMRRLLGIDDNEGKSNTIVQLQVVNDRLKSSLHDEILEGEIMAESVSDVSDEESEQSKLTGCGSALEL